MTLPSESSYPIAELKTLLKERAKIDLSPVELAEILWLALQRGEIATNRERSRRSTLSPGKPDAPEPPLPPATPSEEREKSPTAAVVAEPPRSTGESEQETEAQMAGAALPVSIPETIALRNRQQIARSLRPLKRKVPSKLRQVFDEEATVIASAEAQTWRPVEKPEPERWLELAIVIEVTNLLDVWQDTISEFQQLMERHGAFRDVRTWQLKLTADGDPQLFLQTVAGLKGSARNPKELLDTSGRRLVLLVSDCTSRGWRSGKIPKLLELWSRENPVTIVQLLPEHYWERSALKTSYPVALRSRLPGALSRDWLIEGLSPRQRRHLPRGLKLPVVTIHPMSLGEWARAIAAICEQQTIGVVLDPQAFQTDDAGSAKATPLTAKQLVQQFRKTASDSAQELVDRMAVLPVNWSVIRLIQKNWVPQIADRSQETAALSLAEIFLSGLLRPVSIDSKQLGNRKIKQQYDFADGVRDVLLGTIPISEAQAVGEEIAEVVFKQLPTEVQKRVGADIERRFGGSLRYFEAFLIPDLPWGENAAAEVFPFAQVTGQVLRRWGGNYAALAEELERREASNKQEEQYLDEATVYAALEQHLDYFQQRILDDFIRQEHQFEVHFPGLRSKEMAAETHPEEIILAEGEEISVSILKRTITEISKEQASFELEVKIHFAAELIYFDFDAYHSEFNEHPTYGERVHNQSADAMAEVILWFSEDENDIVPELVELQLEQPLLINPTLTGDKPSAQLPPLQWFEFDVATIAFETSTPSISLQPFLFTLATLTRPFPTEMSVEDKLAAINEEFWNHIGMHLNYVQELILRGTLENKTYQQIATEPHFTSNYLRTKASELWQLLSPILGKKVTKKSFEDTLNRWLWQRCTQRQQREGQQFIEYLDNDFTLEMVQIPAGNVLMGSPENKPERSPSESPQHIVEVTSFFLSKYPVTQAQWRSVAAMPQVNRELDPDPSRFKGDDRPVETIKWYDAVEFCDRLSQHTGKQYRLPSEAEWEYACRAGTTTPFHFGETITPDLANYNGEATYGDGPKGVYRGETTPVGSFGVANDFGLYDMHGNVLEWCADHWHENYEGAPVDGSAWVMDGDSDRRVLRGGSWYSLPHYCRSAYRIVPVAVYGYNIIGFRVACSA